MLKKYQNKIYGQNKNHFKVNLDWIANRDKDCFFHTAHRGDLGPTQQSTSWVSAISSAELKWPGREAVSLLMVWYFCFDILIFCCCSETRLAFQLSLRPRLSPACIIWIVPLHWSALPGDGSVSEFTKRSEAAHSCVVRMCNYWLWPGVTKVDIFDTLIKCGVMYLIGLRICFYIDPEP